MSLQALKQFDPNRGEMEDLIDLYHQGKGALDVYAEKELEIPEWLREKLDLVSEEIDRRDTDRKRQELEKTRVALESLKTPSEKKKDLLSKAARLEKALSGKKRLTHQA